VMTVKDRKPVLPKLVVVITGKGPMKEFYMEKIRKTHWNHVRVLTQWLESADYPRLLGCADLGISLHQSSCGLDLPMKVVDMFGCDLPVIAFGYDTIKELVVPNKTGLLFTSATQLTNHLCSLLEGFPTRQDRLNRMRTEIHETHRQRWPENWNRTVYPLLKQ